MHILMPQQAIKLACRVMFISLNLYGCSSINCYPMLSPLIQTSSTTQLDGAEFDIKCKD